MVVTKKMTSPSRSFFASVKGKLSRRGSDRSVKSDISSHSNAANSSVAGAPASRLGDEAPPPSYTEATLSSLLSGPTITVQPPSRRPGDRAASPAPSGASRISVASLSTPEDPYAFLSTFDTVFVIDDSGSMAGRSWREVREALRAITPICTAHDADGIDVYFLNARNPANPATGGWHNVRSVDQVEQLFDGVRPGGVTPIGTRIYHIVKPYLRAYEQAVAASGGGDPEASSIKPVNMIIITDGVPTDDPEAVIVAAARKLDRLEAPPYQLGIQFFQVGNEPGAADALRELDDALADMAGGGMRDIVDTVTWSGRDSRERILTADSILKVVLGAVVRRLDRRRASGESARPARNSRLAP